MRSLKAARSAYGDQGSDNRSYRVGFDKIHKALPSFSCDWSAEKGARQLYELFKRIDLSREEFEGRGFTRQLGQLEHLVQHRSES